MIKIILKINSGIFFFFFFFFFFFLMAAPTACGGSQVGVESELYPTEPGQGLNLHPHGQQSDSFLLSHNGNSSVACFTSLTLSISNAGPLFFIFGRSVCLFVLAVPIACISSQASNRRHKQPSLRLTTWLGQPGQWRISCGS